MHGNLLNKNKSKMFLTANSDLAARISILENNVYKVTYYEIISGASGTLTVPTGATINSGEFSGANCVLSEIDGSNKPTFVTPLDGGGTPVTSTLNVGTGAWVKSGVTVSTNVALIYSVDITAADYQNLNNFYIIDNVFISSLSQVLTNSGTASTLSSELSRVISDETGSGSLVFGTSPTFVTDITIGTSLIKSIGNISNTSITTTNYAATYPLKNITTGDYNVAIGGNCQQDNQSGSYNISIGTDSMTHLTSGTYNVGTGAGSMGLNTFTGSYNTGFGTDSLRSITNGTYNAGFGHYTQFSLTGGDYNSSLGANSLNANTTGDYNVAIGYAAASLLNGGSYNVNVGFGAGDTSTSANANVTGTYNTYIGTYAGPSTATQYSNSIAIGYNAQTSASNQAVFGSSTITSTILRPTVNINPDNSTAYATALTTTISAYDCLSLYNSNASAGLSAIRFATRSSSSSIGRIALVHTAGLGAFSFMLRSSADTSNTTELFRIESTGSVICNKAAIATTATDGFLYVPSCAGIPTGVPTAVTGRIPIVCDSTNNKMYIYSGGAWVALN